MRSNKSTIRTIPLHMKCLTLYSSALGSNRFVPDGEGNEVAPARPRVFVTAGIEAFDDSFAACFIVSVREERGKLNEIAVHLLLEYSK